MLIGISCVSASDNITEEISNDDAGGEIASVDNNDKLNEKDMTTFESLKDVINNSKDSVILDHNYAYNKTFDEEFVKGIVIDKNNLVIDGKGYSIDGKNLARIFNVTGNGITLQNINFINAKADNGGAVHITGNSVKIVNCTFTNNKADVDGGAAYLRSDYAVIQDTKFINNTAIYNGALFIRSDYGYVSDCLFKDNFAETSAGALGWSYKANGIIRNSRFINNSAVNEGGGAIFWNQGPDGQIINSTFIKNTAEPDGGALFINNATNFQIRDSKFEDNNATAKGGSIYWFGGNGEIINSAFNNDFAAKDGGAVYFRGNNSIISYSNFTNNKAHYNGAVYMNSIQGSIHDCIFTNNTAIDSAGALGWVKKENGTIAYCNFVNNSAPRGGALYLNNGTEFYIRGSVFENNNASINGGAVFWDTGNEGRLIGCVFKNNNAENLGGAICWNNTENGYISHSRFNNNTALDGGAIYFRGSNGLIIYSNFINNQAEYNGAIYMNSAHGVIDSCLFENNAATNSSGALGWVKKQNGLINNTQFIANTAGEGGALYVNDVDNFTVDNSKFIRNAATLVGGAICWDHGENGIITNTLFDNNTANSGGAIFTSGTINVKNNIFKNNHAKDGNDDIVLDDNGTIKYIVGFKISAFDNVYAKNATIVVSLINDGQAANKGTVSITVNNITYKNNVSNGTAAFQIQKFDAGTYNVNVAYIGDSTYNNHTETYNLVIDKQDLDMTSKSASYIINYGGQYSVTINGIAGGKVIFTLDNKIIATATTNEKGVARITLTSKILKAAKAGKKSLVIKLDNANYESQGTVSITIDKEKTKISAKKAAFKAKKTKKYSIALKNSKGKAINKVNVYIKVGKKTYKATTNAKGKATFKINKLTKKGKYTAKISFKGNDYYKASAKKVKIKVK